MVKKYNVSVIGATGMAGQQFMEALVDHPWFEIVSVHGHSSVGKKYGDAIRGFTSFKYPEEVLETKVRDTEDVDIKNTDIIFSAIPSKAARDVEGKLAKTTPVISTASAYRYEPDVPIFLPMINGEHYEILDAQKKNRRWEGFVLPGPNCTVIGLAMSLYPIYKNFGIKSIHMTSMQAITGAGYPGVPSYDIIANVIPHIPEEEGKVIKEAKKILGTIDNGKFKLANFLIDCKCNRVPSINGHMESVFLETEREFSSIEEIKDIFRSFKGQTAELGLPNVPEPPIKVFDNPFRPQPRIDLADKKNGMITFIGGIEKTHFPNGIKYTVLSHNTELGAGRGGVLSAEYLIAKKYI
ncbi:MAG: aspartate-semialdehyde dehydrogenase [Promethearchaeota archaeon]